MAIGLSLLCFSFRSILERRPMLSGKMGHFRQTGRSRGRHRRGCFRDECEVVDVYLGSAAISLHAACMQQRNVV